MISIIKSISFIPLSIRQVTAASLSHDLQSSGVLRRHYRCPSYFQAEAQGSANRRQLKATQPALGVQTQDCPVQRLHDASCPHQLSSLPFILPLCSFPVSRFAGYFLCRDKLTLLSSSTWHAQFAVFNTFTEWCQGLFSVEHSRTCSLAYKDRQALSLNQERRLGQRFPAVLLSLTVLGL